jgi:EAL domain-containing protein (putative c-di-GMP-specific phosphodiesterase class I)
VTAEGIESAEQLEHLRALGCDHGQGYYFAKPMASDRVPGLLATTAPWDASRSATASLNGR